MGYYERFYANTFYLLDEKYNFHGRHRLPKLIQEETDNFSSPVSTTKFKLVV